MDKDSKIIVFGGTGLVGGAVLRKLLEKGYKDIWATSYKKRKPEDVEQVRWIEGVDLRDCAQVERIFASVNPEYVFLCAAKVGGIWANNTYKAEFIYDNLAMGMNIVHFAWKYNVRKLLNLGSSCIYPKNCPQPMKEEYLLTGPLEPTNEPYAVAKISVLKMCRFYNEQYGTDFISVMPTNLYGPGDNFHLLNSHVLPALIRKFHLGKLYMEGRIKEIARDVGFWEDCKGDVISFLETKGIFKDRVQVWGRPDIRREFLFVDDLAEACIFLMERVSYEEIGEVINIGVGEDISIEELANTVKDIVGYKGDIVWDSSKPVGVKRKLLDVNRIRSLGWSPKIDLNEGIKKTYQSYLRLSTL